jgi:hypothetical protein
MQVTVGGLNSSLCDVFNLYKIIIWTHVLQLEFHQCTSTCILIITR